ncbi:hypothetical protein F4805DRAFT_190177 [Annulohypoxylon moriforme]|nr:hypothetical protein F4805DRAFT_190177 [Annulohypoxylon moriforme]
MVNSSLEESNDNGSAENRGSTKSGGSRPSFTDYWKRTKDAARSITFVSSGPEAQAGPSKGGSPNSNNGNAQESDLSKAKARRAQVRKAQIQHRERKANYTKQLEMDVVRLRDLIEQTERHSSILRTENETIRHRLSLGSASSPGTVPNLDYALSQPEYTVSLLAGSDSQNSPLYQVQRIPTPISMSPGSVGGEYVDASGIPGMVLGMTMSQEQVDHAINFILGLEHICWNHFHPSYYDHNNYDPEAKENGHMLMASALALRSAPNAAWELIAAEKERRNKANPSAAGSCSGPGPSRAPPAFPISSGSNDPNSFNTNPNANAALTSWQLPPHPHNSPHSHSHPNDPNILSGSTNTTTEPSLTLESLYNLASTLNPADGPELAPVQAWFEIARLYGAAVVLNAGTMDRVRAALAPSVECLHFGAVMTRAAFEGAVEGVLGPIPGPGTAI